MISINSNLTTADKRDCPEVHGNIEEEEEEYALQGVEDNMIDIDWVMLRRQSKSCLNAEISFFISLTSSSVTPSFSALRCSCSDDCLKSCSPQERTTTRILCD